MKKHTVCNKRTLIKWYFLLFQILPRPSDSVPSKMFFIPMQEFHYTSPIDNSYEMRRKFLKRTSSEVNCSNSREEDLVHLNTPVLSLKKLYKARGLVELPKFASLKLRVPQQSHLIRPIPICAVQSYQQRQSQSFKQVGELPQPPDHISIQQDPPQHALPSKPFVFV
jgi:hypothetical protein